MPMTPAERLLAAADLLDKLADGATGGPWEARFTGLAQPTISVVGEIAVRPHDSAATTIFAGVDEDRADSGDLDESEINWVSENDARYIATMHPEVGRAVAGLLRSGAEWVKRGEGQAFGGGDLSRPAPDLTALADLILAGTS